MTTTAPHPPLQGAERVLGTTMLSLATFMNVLDASIANVSLPAIAGDLGASVHQGTWVITSFGIATAISMPLTGWLTQRFGQVRLFVASVLLFVLASFCCGQAPSIEWLIGFRVLQGLVAGPMMPLSQILVMAQSSARACGQGAGGLVDDHLDCADCRALAGRLDQRQHALGLDLLHQCSDRTDLRVDDLAHLSSSRVAEAAHPG